jgi:hypothetical protein
MILKRIGTILVMLWAARGVLLLMGAIMAFARGMLPLTPDAVQNVFAPRNSVYSSVLLVAR